MSQIWQVSLFTIGRRAMLQEIIHLSIRQKWKWMSVKVHFIYQIVFTLVITRVSLFWFYAGFSTFLKMTWLNRKSYPLRYADPLPPFHSSFRSSFAKADRQHFDLAKLLDPFEKLEREFNWEEVTPLRPPSAFSTSQTEECAKKASAVTIKFFKQFGPSPASFLMAQTPASFSSNFL